MVQGPTLMSVPRGGLGHTHMKGEVAEQSNRKLLKFALPGV